MSPEIKSQVKRDVGEYLIEQILVSVGNSKSPLTNERYKALSKDYKAKKEADGAPGIPNLDLYGDMLGALEYRETSNGIELGVFGEEAPKADGHNNFSGKSRIPERRFLPGEGESFRPGITKEVEGIIAEGQAGDTPPVLEDFEEVTTSSSFYDILIDKLGVDSRSEARNAIITSPVWYEFVRRTGLIRYL